MNNPWTEWLSKIQAKRNEERQARIEKARKELKVFRPITPDELRKIIRLQRVSTAWGSMDRRFIGQFEQATTETMITDRQGEFIQILWYKYRRQLNHNDPKPESYEGRK